MAYAWEGHDWSDPTHAPALAVPDPRTLSYDRDLADRLRGEREARGNDRLFYMRAAWRSLRERVIDEWRGACADCLVASPSRFNPATTVHHDAHVEELPGWSLSEWWLDESGPVPVVRRNLWPLCERHHNERHGRFEFAEPRHAAEVTPERW